MTGHVAENVLARCSDLHVADYDYVKETEFARNVTHLATDGAPPAVLPLVCGVLHAGGDEPVAAQQVPLQPLVREETELALLAVQGRPVVDHLGVDLHLQIYQVIHCF